MSEKAPKVTDVELPGKGFKLNRIFFQTRNIIHHYEKHFKTSGSLKIFIAFAYNYTMGIYYCIQRLYLTKPE